MKRLSVLINSAGVFAIAAGVILLISGLITSKSDFMEDLYQSVGSISEYLAIGAACLWLGRYVFTFLKKRKIGLSNYFPPVLKLLKKHHTVIGWAVLALASGHGAYFFFKTSEHMDRIYTGLAAFIGLVVLALVGLILDKWVKGKKFLSYRKIHKAIAVVFGIALVVHLMI